MKPIIISLSQTKVTVQAESQSAAERFARSYCGDYRTDFRNRNQVEFSHADYSNPRANLYTFTIEEKRWR